MNSFYVRSNGTSAILELPNLTRRGVTTDRGMKQLGQQLVDVRKQKGITQVDLARRLGVTQPVVSQMEQGTLRLNGEVIIKLASIFGITTDELLGVKNANGHNGQPVAKRWLKRLGRINELPKRDQDALIRTIDRFLTAAEK